MAEVSEDDLVEAMEDESANEVELVWREHLPLGMNLLMNDDSGLLKVVDFPRGSQARKVVEERKLDSDVFEGSTIMAVNGTRYGIESQEELIEALKDPGRPKSVSFQLSNSEDAERIRRFVAGMSVDDSNSVEDESTQNDTPAPDNFAVKNIEITKVGPLGIQFTSSIDDFSLIVDGFLEDNGMSNVADNDGVAVGDILISVNDEYIVADRSRGISSALSLLEASASMRPLKLGFSKPYLELVVLKNSTSGITDVGDPSEEIVFGATVTSTGASRVVLKGFNDVSGLAEAGGVTLGDYLVFVNGIPVGAGCQFYENGPSTNLDDVTQMCNDQNLFPLALTFARPSQHSRWGSFKM